MLECLARFSQVETYLLTSKEGELSRKAQPFIRKVLIEPSFPARVREIFFRKFPENLLSRIQKLEIDIIHCNDTVSAVWMTYHKKRHRRRMVFHCRVPHLESLKDRLLDLWLIRRCDRIIVLNEHSAQRFPDWARSKLSFIPNSINLEYFHPLPKNYSLHRELKISKDSFVIGSLSRFHPGKCQDRLIQAAEPLCRKYPKLHIVMAGNPQEAPEFFQKCQRLVDDLQLDQQIHFYGYVSDPREFLRNIDLLSVYTYGEAMSRTILEGMAMGKCIVASQDGGNPDLIQDQMRGLLVPLDQLHKFTETLDTLIEDSQLREKLAQGALQEVQQYSDPRVAEKLIKFYEELLQTEDQ